jgi:TonB family protein
MATLTDSQCLVAEFLRVVRWALVFLLAATATLAQQPENNVRTSAPNAAAATAANSPSYPDTADGLRDFVQALIKAVENHDSQESALLTQSLIVPDYKTWFPQVFGPDTGGKMSELYEESLNKFSSNLIDVIEDARKHKQKNVVITLLRTEDTAPVGRMQPIFQAMQNPVALYSVGLGKGRQVPWNLAGLFVYVQGGFRAVSLHALHAIPGALPTRIRLGPSAAVSRLIHRVDPAFPAEAKRKRPTGTVLVHIIIDYDGSVSDAEATSGDPMLTKAAVDAVRQWRFRPTALNGEPVQVDTVIGFVFSIGN